MIELMSLKKVMTRLSVLFVIIIAFFFKKTIKCPACVFDDCHDLLHRAVSFDDAVIVIASKIITEFIYGI